MSGKAMASLVLGLFFFLPCLSGVPAILLGRHALSDIRASGGRLRGRATAIVGIVLGVFGCLFTLAYVLPATIHDGERPRRAQCMNNLKQIGLAMGDYHEAYGCLPAAAITDKNGRPLLSWRVAILPFMEKSALYAKFHLDEPWDSPHNYALLSEIPAVYLCASDHLQKTGLTNYQVVVGPDTSFTPDFKPLRFSDFSDGVKNTLLVGESRTLVPWTKPEDRSFDMSVPLSGLGSSYQDYFSKGFNVVFSDSSVRYLKTSIASSELKGLLTRNGREPVELEGY